MVTLWLLVTDQKKHHDASPLMGLFTPSVSKPWLTHFQWKKTTFLPAPGEEEAGAVYFHKEMRFLALNNSHHRWPRPKERTYLRGRLMAEAAPEEEVALRLGYIDTDGTSQSAFQSRLHNDNYGKVALVRGYAAHASKHIKERSRRAPTAS